MTSKHNATYLVWAQARAQRKCVCMEKGRTDREVNYWKEIIRSQSLRTAALWTVEL